VTGSWTLVSFCLAIFIALDDIYKVVLGFIQPIFDTSLVQLMLGIASKRP
jgi:hypothetical protein